MGTTTALVARMSVLLIMLSTFVFAESVVGKPWGTRRKRGNADRRSVGVEAIDQMLGRIQSNTILTIALILLVGFNVGYFLFRFLSESQNLFNLISGDTMQVTWTITL